MSVDPRNYDLHLTNKIMQHDNEGTNIASYLIADARKRDTLESDKHLLAGEAIVAIVAGR